MKKEVKGFVCGVILTALLSCGVSAVGIWDNINVLKNDINVIVNGKSVTADNFLYNDTTYLPLRAVSTALGEKVEYDEATNTAYIGERKDNDVMIGKYTPPSNIINNVRFIIEEDGIYYITLAGINELNENIYFDFEPDNLQNDTFNVDIKKKGSEMPITTINCFYVKSSSVIPYDTYVDEIEPLLK